MKTLLIIIIALTCNLLFSEAATIRQIKEAIVKKNAKWNAENNLIFSQPFEIRKLMCGTKLPEKLPPVQVEVSYENLSQPDNFRWDNYGGYNWLTPVRNQSSCGSCWAFAAVGVFEGQEKITNGNPFYEFDFSEQYLVSTCCNAGDCGGGDHGSALAFIVNPGIPDEACFPYKAKNADCSERCSDWQSRMKKAASSYNIASITVPPLKEALRKGPVAVSFMVYEDFQAYKGGVYEYTYGSFLGGHAVVLAGWDDAFQCWVCKNSWGASWGEKGYFRIKYGNCGIGLLFNYACTVNKDEKSLRVDIPNGGEYWKAGSSEIIKWTPTGEVRNVDILFTTDAGLNWQNIAASESNDGEFSWMIPDDTPRTTIAKVKVVESNTYETQDQSDNYFTIEEKENSFLDFAKGKFLPDYGIKLISRMPVKDKAIWEINLPRNTNVAVQIFDINGKFLEEQTFTLSLGKGNYTWNPAKSGVFIVVFKINKTIISQKIVVVK